MTLDDKLAQHLAQDVTTLATCWRISRKDGVVETYTTHDGDLTFAGNTYISSGLSQTNTKAKMSLEIDNLEVHGLVNNVESSFANVGSRVYDESRVEVFRVNYKDLPNEITTTSVLWVKKGVGGDLFYEKGKWVLEVRGFKQILKQRTGSKTSRLCKAEFGDSNCRADLNLYSHSGTVTTHSSKTLMTNISTLPTGGAQQGKVVFDATGVVFDIVNNSGGTLVLPEELGFDPDGMEVTVVQGCNKWLDDCSAYNNLINFYGEPHVPSEDSWAAGYFETVSVG